MPGKRRPAIEDVRSIGGDSQTRGTERRTRILHAFAERGDPTNFEENHHACNEYPRRGSRAALRAPRLRRHQSKAAGHLGERRFRGHWHYFADRRRVPRRGNRYPRGRTRTRRRGRKRQRYPGRCAPFRASDVDRLRPRAAREGQGTGRRRGAEGRLPGRGCGGSPLPRCELRRRAVHFRRDVYAGSRASRPRNAARGAGWRPHRARQLDARGFHWPTVQGDRRLSSSARGTQVSCAVGNRAAHRGAFWFPGRRHPLRAQALQFPLSLERALAPGLPRFLWTDAQGLRRAGCGQAGRAGAGHRRLAGTAQRRREVFARCARRVSRGSDRQALRCITRGAPLCSQGPAPRNRQPSAKLTTRKCTMNAQSAITESVVRNHLQTFLEQKGIAAILDDYDENARFYSEARVYHGKREIHDFFVGFMGSLPAGAVDRFSLRSLRIDGNLAYITWSVGSDIPLGTDTFVVDNGKIVSQTFAMYAAPAR